MVPSAKEPQLFPDSAAGGGRGKTPSGGAKQPGPHLLEADRVYLNFALLTWRNCLQEVRLALAQSNGQMTVDAVNKMEALIGEIGARFGFAAFSPGGGPPPAAQQLLTHLRLEPPAQGEAAPSAPRTDP